MDCHSLIFFKPASAEAECRIIIHILLVRLVGERKSGGSACVFLRQTGLYLAAAPRALQ